MSIDEENSFDKIKYLFIIKKKNSPESRHGGNLPQQNKNYI